MLHPLLQRFLVGAENRLENVYLDTTYMTPKYNFPKQEQVCESVATLIHEFANNDTLVKEVFGSSLQTRITDFLTGKKATSKKISRSRGNVPHRQGKACCGGAETSRKLAHLCFERAQPRR
ncbi:hypothetical protein OXX80_013912 [Metschnikowia pulcherrima]